MLELAPNLALVLLACVGAGHLLLCRGGGPGESLEKLGLAGLMGIAVLSMVAGLFNLLLSLGQWGVWLLAPLAIWGLIVIVPRLREKPGVVLALVGMFFVVLVFSSRPIYPGDTALYHHQAVLWMGGWQLPAGLANLHGRFGFNSSWWAFSGLLEFLWFERGESIYLPVGVLCFFFGCLFLGAVWTLREGAFSVSSVLLLTSGYLWFRQLTGVNTPSLATDAPANLFLVASAWCFVKWIEKKDPVWFLSWCVLAATAASFKMTALPWLAGSAVCALPLLWQQFKAGKSWRDCSEALSAIGLGFLIVAVYWIRGLVISGYPFYPLKIAGIAQLPWAASLHAVEKDVSGIRLWPTRGTEASGIWEFLVTWVENQFGWTNIFFGCVVLGVGLLVLFRLLPRIGLRHLMVKSSPFIPLLLAAVAAFALCFSFAPALRFVSGTFFVAAGLSFGIAASLLPCEDRPLTGKILVVACVLAAVVPNMGGVLSRSVSFVVLPEIHTPEVREMVTKQGETVRINPFTWAVEPPAAPYFQENMEILRDSRGRIRAFALQR